MCGGSTGEEDSLSQESETSRQVGLEENAQARRIEVGGGALWGPLRIPEDLPLAVSKSLLLRKANNITLHAVRGGFSILPVLSET